MRPLIAILFLTSTLHSAEPPVKVSETKVISQQPQYYHGWPTLMRKLDGTLIVVVSGGRHGHVCPFGRVELMTSRDEGKTWTFPRTILDTDVDDRDAGALETPKGTLRVTTFTSLAYELQMNNKNAVLRQAHWKFPN